MVYLKTMHLMFFLASIFICNLYGQDPCHQSNQYRIRWSGNSSNSCVLKIYGPQNIDFSVHAFKADPTGSQPRFSSVNGIATLSGPIAWGTFSSFNIGGCCFGDAPCCVLAGVTTTSPQSLPTCTGCSREFEIIIQSNEPFSKFIAIKNKSVHNYWIDFREPSRTISLISIDPGDIDTIKPPKCFGRNLRLDVADYCNSVDYMSTRCLLKDNINIIAPPEIIDLPKPKPLNKIKFIDIYHNVPFYRQPNGCTCWATSLAMYEGYCNSETSANPNSIVKEFQIKFNSGNCGLGVLNYDPYERLGYSAWMPTQSLASNENSVELFAGMLEKSPLLVSYNACSGNIFNKFCGHAVIVIGLKGDGTPTGTRVIIHDPDDGSGIHPNAGRQDFEMPFSTFISRLNSWTDRAVPQAGTLINYIAYKECK